MSLNQEQAEYYDALDDMFSTKGWKLVIEEAKAQIYQNQADSLEVPNWEQVCVLRGKSLSLNELVNLELVSHAQRDSLEEPDDADL